MKHLLEIEAVGDDIIAAARKFRDRMEKELPGAGRCLKVNSIGPWVAHIMGRHERYQFAREFLRPNRDYSRANKDGSHGVRYFYAVEEGGIYEVQERRRGRAVRYFCVIESGRARRIAREDVLDRFHE